MQCLPQLNQAGNFGLYPLGVRLVIPHFCSSLNRTEYLAVDRDHIGFYSFTSYQTCSIRCHLDFYRKQSAKRQLIHTYKGYSARESLMSQAISHWIFYELLFCSPLCLRMTSNDQWECVFEVWSLVEGQAYLWCNTCCCSGFYQRELRFEPCTASMADHGQVFHSILLQFTHLYEWVPGYKHWWIFLHGWMLPREIEMVFERTGLQGVKCKALVSNTEDY